ncbi:hypothetical protein [Leptospira sp. GIMC2001]|uniref:hypothetical protein n=1 Tax=Leptospira sp. GIMC2001 TaxID=1513297 RepID=UPI00234B1E60|nr:hypothetical protein [Leptospira sp. GIMC2001]WCL49394.1 hypothetical protein O4O04_19205 [Leptospira sp. GIMC2001]
MTVIKDAYNKILEGIADLQDFANSTQNFLSTTKTIVTTTIDFLEPIFNFLPWEVFLILLVAILLLSWVNVIFPTTPKLNFTFVVIFICFGWGYSEYIASGSLDSSISFSSRIQTVSWSRIAKAAIYLLLPVHIISILIMIWKYSSSAILKRKKLNPADLSVYLKNLSDQFHKTSSIGHKILAGEESGKKDLETSIIELEEIVKSWKNLKHDSKN